MNAWGWALIHFLWQGAAIALALGAALRAWRGKAPEWRYGAACAALGLMTLAPAVTALALAGRETAGSVVMMGAGGRLEIEEAAAAAGMRLDMQWLVWAWAAGAAALLLRAGGGWHLARRRAQAGVPLDYALSRLMDRMEMTGVVELMECAAARTPYTFGWLKPVIVVPAAAMARLAPAEFEALLAHELAHIRRRDYLVNLMQTVAEALLFYHPAVWWVSRRIREERELCCDDWAVRVCGDRVAYSKALLKVEEEAPMLAMAAAAGLKARIARLLGMESETQWRWSAPMAPLAAAALAAMVAGGPWWAAAAPPDPPLAPEAPGAPAAVMAQAPGAPPAPAKPPKAPAPPRAADEEAARREAEIAAQVREQVERAAAELKANEGRIKEELQRAMEQVRKDLETIDTAEAKRAMERALRELQRQDGQLQKQLEQARRSMERALAQNERALAQNERARARAAERFEEQERRTKYADERFGQGGTKGSDSDRGRTYRRYGPPDEIESQAGVREVWKYRNFRGTGGTMVFEFEGPEHRLKSKPE